MKNKTLKRKGIFGILAISLVVILSVCNAPSGGQSSSEHGNLSDDFDPDLDIEIVAREGQASILEGAGTEVYSYQASVISGEEEALQPIEGSYLGPVIRVRQGQQVRIRFNNELQGSSIIHWHGMHLSPAMDGQPQYAIGPGEEYIYEFTVSNPPGTYWYHPHPEGITGLQVYMGLAGMLIVEDEDDQLPEGDYDLPVVIQDRSFDDSNQLIYHQGGMMRMQGFLGDQILVNGLQEALQQVDQATYRLRVLNGSNSRIYKLAWDDGSPLIVTTTDGGRLQEPVSMPYLMLGPGQRVEVWKDFSGYEGGRQVVLQSLPFEGGMSMGMGMGGGHMRRGRRMAGQPPQESLPDNGAAFGLIAFETTGRQGQVKELPGALNAQDPFELTQPVNDDQPREFYFYNERMQWVINGETFEMNEVAEWEKVSLGTTERWRFVNGSDEGQSMGMPGGPGMGDMMQMPHPVHVHGLSFRIVNRDVSEMDPQGWDSVKDGFLDEGWHDTFLLMPGMKVDVLLRFVDFTGVYLYHCHNLEHHDMGMMRNYEVIAE